MVKKPMFYFFVFVLFFVLASANSAMATPMRTTISGTLNLILTNNTAEMNFLNSIGVSTGNNMELVTIDYDDEGTFRTNSDGSTTPYNFNVYDFMSDAIVRFSPIVSHIILTNPGNVSLDRADLEPEVTNNYVVNRLDNLPLSEFPDMSSLILDHFNYDFTTSWFDSEDSTNTGAGLEFSSRDLTLYWNTTGQDTTTATPVPEPSTMLLLSTGIVGMIGAGRKKLFKK